MELWVIFALIAPVIWAVINLTDTKLRRKYVTDDYVITAFGGVITFLLAIAMIPIVGFSVPTLQILILSLVAGMILIYLVIPYFIALNIEETSRVVTLWFITPALLPLFAFIFLGEVLTFYQYLGFSLVVLGGAAISIKKTSGNKKIVSKALWLMLLSGILFNIYLVMIKYIYNNYNFWHGFIWIKIGLFIGLLTFFISRKNRKALVAQFKLLNKKSTSLVIGSGIMDFGATILFTVAIALGPVSLVVGLNNFQPLYLLVLIVFLGKFFPKLYKEEVGKGILGIKLLSIILMLVGLWLIGG